MKTLILLIFSSLIISSSSFCQDSITLAKYEVLGTGALVNFPDKPDWSVEWSEDSSKVISAFTEIENIGYGTILIVFSSELGDDSADWQSMLESYVQYLSESVFELTSVYTPVLTNKITSGQESASYFIEGYDDNDYIYYIQGWSTGKMLLVMYVGFNEYDNPKIEIVYKFLEDVVIP